MEGEATGGAWWKAPQRVSTAGASGARGKGDAAGGGTAGSKWQRSSREPRACPFYKKMPGTQFTVDAFRYGAVPGCTAYFLTHFHSDHYGGLTKAWRHGPIYCTPVTARLVVLCLGLSSEWLRPVEIGDTVVVDRVAVTMVPANHCPGAALILFQLPGGTTILHTGDFRASAAMQQYPHLAGTRVDLLYLDTTYCDARYCFPLQELVIRFVVEVARAALAQNPRLLLAVGAYSIGKERVFLGLARALGVKIYADRRRRRVLAALEWPELAERLTDDATCTPLHVVPIFHVNTLRLRNYLREFQPRHTAALGFRPTGWTYSAKVGGDLRLLKPQRAAGGLVTVYGVPYSEHSSFDELREFVQFLQPGKVIPTVNVGSPEGRRKMEAHISRWLHPPLGRQPPGKALSSGV